MSTNNKTLTTEQLRHFYEAEYIALTIIRMVTRYTDIKGINQLQEELEKLFIKAGYQIKPFDAKFEALQAIAISRVERKLEQLSDSGDNATAQPNTQDLSSLLDGNVNGENIIASLLEAINSQGKPSYTAASEASSAAPDVKSLIEGLFNGGLEEYLKENPCTNPNCPVHGKNNKPANNPKDYSITPAEVEALRNTKSADEWSKVNAGILKRRDGNKPPDWTEKVIASGVVSDAVKQWNL